MYDHIPGELKSRPQWVAWNLVERAGKKTKLPINPKNGQLAKTDDPTTWGTFEQAVRTGRQLNGVGYVFSADDPYCGIDLDGHIDQELVEWFGSYAERSQSGKGVHIICRGHVAEGRKNARYEIYGSARYFVMTGDVIHDRPIADCQEQIDAFLAAEFPKPERKQEPAQEGPQSASVGRVDLSDFMGGICNGAIPAAEPLDPVSMAKASAQGAKFSALWDGLWQAEGYESQSSADAALLAMLRFWTGGDQEQSFALFRQSGLMRPKFDRQDYRQRTWRAIDSGEVFTAHAADYITGKRTTTPPVVEIPITPERLNDAASPWRKTKIEHAMDAIEGTQLGVIANAMREPMRDQQGKPLPAEVGLLKAIVLAGLALSGKREKPRDGGNLTAHTAKGVDLARVRIMTGGGQVANVMAMLVGETSNGKDVGGLLPKVANSLGLYVGNSGSEEGIADAYITKPNGLLAISEFSPFIDKNDYRSKVAGFLTSAWNEGFFAYNMSKRTQGAARESNYCYPNVFASIQPNVLAAKASTLDIDSGFLGRFLFAQIPGFFDGEATGGDYTPLLDLCKTALSPYLALDQDFVAPKGYPFPLFNIFRPAKAEPVSTWKRLCNEYYPRFALMLSAELGKPFPQEIPDRAWEKATVLVKYFFAQAEAILTDVRDDPATVKRETLEKKLLAYIKKAGAGGVSHEKISSDNHRGNTAKERQAALDELTNTGRAVMRRVGAVRMYHAV